MAAAAEKALSASALFLLLIYKAVLSPFFNAAGGCRFYPSCSEYAAEAFKKDSFLQASAKTLARLLRCHPFGPKWANEVKQAAKKEANGGLNGPQA